MVNLQNYLRIKQAAEFIGVSESALRNWERSGKIGLTTRSWSKEEGENG